ncbi:MAG: hypothetical protein NC833_05340 [Candidatus Omnitrophica bacterium]|nr:hypothetical protein [Candidatus Omnitrophota bacterium]
MKNFIIYFLILSLFSSCSFFKIKGTFLDKKYRENYVKSHPQLKEEWRKNIIEGKIPNGMDKKEVEDILGKNYQTYKSDTELMEIWFYENYYVGFDKYGKVVKFGIYKKDREK